MSTPRSPSPRPLVSMLVIGAVLPTALLLGCEEEPLLRLASPEVAPPSSDEDAAPATCEFVSEGRTLGIAQFEWAAWTDRQGLVRELHETRRPGQPVFEAEGFGGGLDLRTRFTYDAQGRVERVERTRSSDGEPWETEEVRYRADQGVAEHNAWSGPAYEARFGTSYRLEERRWLVDGVELIDEQRTRVFLTSGDTASERRWMDLGSGGEVVERVDADGDGVAEHRVVHALEPGDDGSVVISTLVKDDEPERELARRTTEFGRGGRPLRQALDHPFQGWQQVVIWYAWEPDALFANVLDLSDGELSSRYEATWARSGARQSYVNAEDARADGDLDWVQDVQFFGDRLIRNNQIFDEGRVTWNYPVRTDCPDVIPRLATPDFRPHCPLRAFSICMLHDHQRPYIPVW